MTIYLNAKSRDGQYIMNPDGKRKEYAFYSVIVKQSWFEFASAQVSLSQSLLSEEYKLIFVLSDDGQKIFEGRITKRWNTDNGEEINLVNIIENHLTNSKTKSLLGKYLKKNNALKQIPLISSPYNQEQRGLFDGQGKVIDGIIPLEARIVTNSGSQSYRINITFSYIVPQVRIIDFTDELFGKEGFLTGRLPSQMIDGWPKEGSLYGDNNNIKVISSKIRNYRPTTNSPWITEGELTFEQTVLAECYEKWTQVIRSKTAADEVHVNLHIDLDQVLDNLGEWAPGKRYYLGSKVAYKNSEDDFQFLYCKKSHVATGGVPDMRYWDSCGDGHSLLKENFLFESRFGKKLYKEVVGHVLVDLWSQMPPATLHLKVFTADVANVWIGDKIIINGDKYIVIDYVKEYKHPKSMTKIIAHKMPLEELSIALDREYSVEYGTTLIKGPSIEEGLVPRRFLKIHFPKFIQRMQKMVKIGDLNA